MNVLDIAKQRRATLSRELSKLDDFIRMGEELVKDTDTKARPSGDQGQSPNTVREFAAGQQGRG